MFLTDTGDLFAGSPVACFLCSSDVPFPPHGVLNGVLGRKDRNNLGEDVDYAEMLFVLLNWPGGNNSILQLPSPRLQVHICCVREDGDAILLGSMGEIGCEEYSDPSHPAKRWQYQPQDYATASWYLKPVRTRSLLEEKKKSSL